MTEEAPHLEPIWCGALNYKPLREPMPDWAILVPEEGGGQQMAIKVVSSDSESQQRHHLDLYASNRKSEVERLLRLGARRVEWRYPEGADDVVLSDSDGNTFCVIAK